MFPIGNMGDSTLHTPDELGDAIRRRRQALGLRQEDLALTAGTGRRFIIDLESGKRTTRLDPLFRVLAALGLEITLAAPGPADGDVSRD